MRLAGAVVLLMFLTGGLPNQGTGGSEPSRSQPGVQPATMKELPWFNVPGGRMKTTLFYGPNNILPVHPGVVGPNLPYTDH